MSRSFYATRGDSCDSNPIARRAKFDVITAAMLTGGASGGWGMAEVLKSRAARLIETRPCSLPAAVASTRDADANAGVGGSQILPLPAFRSETLNEEGERHCHDLSGF